MVSKRQKLARKRFLEANPDLIPKPQPPQDPTSKNKKKRKPLKPRKKTPTSSSSSKHPLRVPGMRPGESCFICKSKDHIAKLCPEKSHWEKHKICLLCRQHGHGLKNCPQKSDTSDKKFCYNCGEAGHSLSKCPLPLEDGGTTFATCFICNESGHLSKNCPKNTHGIYPKGGSCKICGGVTHLAKDCPNKVHQKLGPSSRPNTFSASAQGKRTIFHSGDDLEDDFTAEDVKNTKKDATSDSGLVTAKEMEKNNLIKPKKREAPKVVNFLG